MKAIISLGAGVQSTAVALMARAGLIEPMPDCAIFADTGDEPAATYRHLAWLMEPGRLPFQVHVVRAWEGYGKPSITGPLGDQLLDAGDGRLRADSRPPLFVRNPDGTGGMLRRQCTGDYKIDVIHRKIRHLLGLKARQRWPVEPVVEQWMGISTDEATRAKPSQISAIRTRWPLLDLGMSRRGCLHWLEAKGFPIPPKSSCTFCPYHSDAQWRQLRDTDPEGWAKAVRIDEALRERGLLGGDVYLHRSLKPLREVDLSTAEERGQINLFENECAGVCGV